MKELISKIKEKKELSDVLDSLVEETLENYIKKHNIKFPLKKKEEKLLIKEIRSILRNYVGRFQTKPQKNKRIALLEKNKIQDLLKTHSSTKERIDAKIYPKLIRKIKSFSPESILDLGCGLNPIALAGKLDAYYYAADIKESELNLIKSYFEKKNISGKVFAFDLRKQTNFPKTDLVLILKTLDILEENSHEIAERLILSLKSKYIIASFSTKTLSGKPMRFPRRAWFERILKRHDFSYSVSDWGNEIFYFIQKSNL